MFKKFTHMLMALTMALGVTFASAHEAEARRGHGIGLGIAAGIIGLSVLGAAAHSGYDRGPRHYSRYDDDGGYCYRGPRECHWAGRRCFENRWGDTVCRGGRYVCERPLICD